MKKMTTLQFITCLILCPILCLAQNRYEDSLALVALYNATNGPNWTNTWNLAQPMDTWYGVNLDSNGRIICIDMDGDDNDCTGDYDKFGNNLSGNIPPEIGNLSSLRRLYLLNNQLIGSIPPEMGNLNDLQSLLLGGNQLTGSIPPEFEHLDNAQTIDVGYNQLSGTIPPQIGGMESLSTLHLWGNQLTGDIPPEIGNLSSLWSLKLHGNQLTGTIPPAIGNLGNLRILYLHDNQFTGTIPTEITNLEHLVDLYVSHNQLNGCYDDSLLSLCNLSLTNAHISDHNEFLVTWEDFCNTGEGCTPCRQSDSLALVALYESTDGANWANPWNLSLPMDTWYGISLNSNGCVICIDMDGDDNNCTGDYDKLGNNLSGNIPSEIGNLGSLETLYLLNNQLIGNIPAEIGNLTNLTSILLGGNQLTGSIPPEIGNLSNLQTLDVGYNKLSGEIPPEIGNVENLGTLNLWSNQLTGSIPPEIGNLDNLWFLKLFDNRLTDNIPPEMANLTNLRLIYLHENKLTGNIPSEMIHLNHLVDLRLSGNQLTGNIPDFPPTLETLHLQKNKFSYDEIEAFYYSNHNIEAFQYSPQYHGERQGYTQNFGDTLTLTLSEPLPGNNNQNVSYQWQKNYNELTGVTDSTYTINTLQLSDVGKYSIHMTDPSRVPDLEIISETIYVIVPGYDSYGQPVEYNQIMVEFDNEAERIYYENTYLNPNFGYVTKSCDCNRELHLWQFPSDTAALEVLLAVNTERESIGSRRARLDGGLNNIFNIGPMVSGEGWTWGGDYSGNYPDSVLVFLLDSGADISNWDASSYLLSHAPVDDCYDMPISSGFDYTDSLATIGNNVTDSLGHGTYGFRSISEGLGDNINLKVVPLKVFDKEGEGTLFNFVCALYHAIDHHADIIHVSAGYMGAASDILENAIALSKEKGCLLVTAAGNDGTDIDSIPQYPAYYAKAFYKEGYNGNDSLVHYNNVISVASIGPQDELSGFSNYGNEAVVMSAYGEDMSGYAHTGEKISSSGSSVSAFYVTRELAVEIAKNNNRTYEQIWQDFETNCLRDCPATTNLTQTGKSLDINLNEVYADLRVYLEGTYDTIAQEMRNDLNMRSLLPGQIQEDSTLNHELAVQPYSNIPPYYEGNESVPSVFANYPDEVVDWILISLRAEKNADTELSRTAAWLLENGNIQLLKPLLNDIHTAPDSVYIVIEHRNHLWTMSPQKIPVNRNIITWDFTAQDGYKTPATTGQIQVQPGIWAMLTGDSKQNDIEGGDINGGDKIIWQDDNGKFLLYLNGDFNLNGDVNGEDKGIWEHNNGKFSGIPK